MIIISLSFISNQVQTANKVACQLFGYNSLSGINIHDLFKKPTGSLKTAEIQDVDMSDNEIIGLSGTVVSIWAHMLYTCI